MNHFNIIEKQKLVCIIVEKILTTSYKLHGPESCSSVPF